MLKRFSKAILCIVCIVALVVPTIGTVSASMDDVIFDLTSLGVLEGMSNTDKLDEYMPRGEFAQLVVNAMGYNQVATTMTDRGYFTDCASSPYLGAINLLYESKVLSGTGTGIFGPDSNLTYPQVGKIMVNVLGYSNIVRNTDLSSYYYQASILGVYDDVNSSGDYVTRRDAYIMVRNCLDIDLMTQNFGMFGTGSFEVVEGNTLKSFLATAISHRLTKLKGVVTADCVTYLYNGMDKKKTNVIEIDGVVYKCNFEVPRGLVGMAVDFYVGYGEDANGVITSITTNDKNTVVEFDLADYLGASAGVLKYNNNDNTLKIRYNDTTKMIYNNRRERAYTPASIGNYKDGVVKAIDNNEDEVFDVIYISQYDDAIVERVYAESKQIYFANNQVLDGKKYLSVDDKDIIVSITDAEGNPVTLEEIPLDSVISISKSNDKKVITVVVSEAKTSGVVKLIDDEYVTIETDVYVFKKGVTPELGKFVNAYINFMGEIVYLDVTASYDNYAYVLQANTGSTALSDVKVALVAPGYIREQSEESIGEDGASATSKKLFFRNSAKNIYALAEKVSIDGRKYSAATAAGMIKGQIISYKLNADEKIISADIILPYDEDTYKTYNQNGKVFSKGSGDGFGIDDTKTMSICIPESASATDDDLLVPVMLLNSTEYKIKAYDVDETSHIAGLVVVTENMQAGLPGNITPSSEVGLVKKVVRKIEKDSERLVVNMLTKEGEKNYFVSNLIPNGASFTNLSAGDLILFSIVEGNDELNAYEVIQGANNFDGSFRLRPFQVDEMCLGTVTDLRYDYVSKNNIRWTDEITVDFGDSTISYEVYNTGTPPIFLLEGKNEIKKLSFDEIQINDKVFISANIGVVRAIVVRR